MDAPTRRESRDTLRIPFNKGSIKSDTAASLHAERLSQERAFIEISVEDNGQGISPEDRARIFVPFFTTKPKGTGLGLAICQRLVEGMGGTITVRSNHPHGSIFTIHLPLKREDGKEMTETTANGKARTKESAL